MSKDQIHQTLVDIANAVTHLLELRDHAHADSLVHIDAQLAALSTQRNDLMSLIKG